MLPVLQRLGVASDFKSITGFRQYTTPDVYRNNQNSKRISVQVLHISSVMLCMYCILYMSHKPTGLLYQYHKLSVRQPKCCTVEITGKMRMLSADVTCERVGCRCADVQGQQSQGQHLQQHSHITARHICTSARLHFTRGQCFGPEMSSDHPTQSPHLLTAPKYLC